MTVGEERPVTPIEEQPTLAGVGPSVAQAPLEQPTPSQVSPATMEQESEQETESIQDGVMVTSAEELFEETAERDMAENIQPETMATEMETRMEEESTIKEVELLPGHVMVTDVETLPTDHSADIITTGQVQQHATVKPSEDTEQTDTIDDTIYTETQAELIANPMEISSSPETVEFTIIQPQAVAEETINFQQEQTPHFPDLAKFESIIDKTVHEMKKDEDSTQPDSERSTFVVQLGPGEPQLPTEICLTVSPDGTESILTTVEQPTVTPVVVSEQQPGHPIVVSEQEATSETPFVKGVDDKGDVTTKTMVRTTHDKEDQSVPAPVEHAVVVPTVSEQDITAETQVKTVDATEDAATVSQEFLTTETGDKTVIVTDDTTEEVSEEVVTAEIRVKTTTADTVDDTEMKIVTEPELDSETQVKTMADTESVSEEVVVSTTQDTVDEVVFTPVTEPEFTTEYQVEDTSEDIEYETVMLEEDESPQEPPQFTALIQPQITHEGDTGQFQAVVTGLPTPHITWYKDNVVMEMSERITAHHNTATGTVSLTITDTETSDFGNYTCTGTNTTGKAKCTANMVVVRKYQRSQLRYINMWVFM